MFEDLLSGTDAIQPEKPQKSATVSHPKQSQSLPPNWSYDSETQVLLGKFQSLSVSDSELSTFASMLDFSDIAVVTEGLFGLSDFTDATNLVKAIFPKEAQISAMVFQSEEEGENIVTTEKEVKKVISVDQFVLYLEKRKALFEKEKSLQDALTSRSKERCVTCGGDQVHVGREALYLSDISLKGSSVHQPFLNKLGLPMKKVLPSSDWCLTNLVRNSLVSLFPCSSTFLLTASVNVSFLKRSVLVLARISL